MDVFNPKLDNKLTTSPQIWARFPKNIIAGALQAPTLGILNFISCSCAESSVRVRATSYWTSRPINLWPFTIHWKWMKIYPLTRCYLPVLIENTQESVCFIFIITWCTRSRAQIIGLVRAVRTVAISIAFCHTTDIGIQ